MSIITAVTVKLDHEIDPAKKKTALKPSGPWLAN